MSQPPVLSSRPKENRASVALLVTLFFVFLVLPALALAGASSVVCFAAIGVVAAGALATLVLSTP